MEIIKDENLSVLTRVYDHKGCYFLSVALLAGFRLTPPGDMIAEDEIWSLAAENLEKDEALDLVMPKTGAEVFVSGWCFTDNGHPEEVVQAGFRVGKIEKSIVVFGDRIWGGPQGDPYTRPVPFTRMKLSRDRAFGGPGFSPNPMGRGIGGVRLENGKIACPLPNIEDPAHPVAVPGDRPKPAGMGPRGLSWRDDLDSTGTFNDKWLAGTWPGFPDDFDFTIFNLAPPDQRMKGFFAGDETISTLRLTPDEPVLKSALPGLRARFFVALGSEEEAKWHEGVANPDTLWLFPHEKAGVLVWHGVYPVQDDEAADIDRLMAVVERMSDEKKGAGWHEARLAGKKEDGPAPEKEPPSIDKAPLDADRLPDKKSSPAQDDKIASSVAREAAAPFSMVHALTSSAAAHEVIASYEKEAIDAEEKMKEIFRKAGIDPDNPPPLTPPPPGMEVGKGSSSGPPPSATADEVIAFHEKEAADAEERMEVLLRRMGIDPDNLPFLPEEPKTPTAAEAAALLAGLPGDHELLIAELHEAERDVARAKEEAKELILGARQEGDRAAREPVRDGEDGVTRDDISDRPAKGRDMSGMDLRGIDFSGKDLTGAILEKVNLAGRDLTGARLSSAILAGAVLSGARLAGADLTGISGAGLKLDGADLRGADLRGSDLTNADLRGANLNNAVLTDADLSGADLSGVIANGARAERALFVKADLSGADFSQALFTATDLSGTLLKGASFAGAVMNGSWLSDADATDAVFKGAQMEAVKAEGKTVFRKADLAKAALGKSYFEDTDFSSVNLEGADLTMASFTRCSINEGNLKSCRARQADFSKSELAKANLQGADLMESTLRKTRLSGADLTGSNLFAADLYNCTLKGARLDGANVGRTLLSLFEKRS